MNRAPRKIRSIQLVKIQSEQRLAASSELNPAPGSVTNRREARGKGCRAVTKVKGSSPEILFSEADTVVQAAGSISATVMLSMGRSKRARSRKRRKQPRPDLNLSNRRGSRKPAGSEAMARYQKDVAGTREGHSVPRRGDCIDKPGNGKAIQMTLRQSDQPIERRTQEIKN